MSEQLLKSVRLEYERWGRRHAAAQHAMDAMTSPRARYQRMLSFDTTVPRAALSAGQALAWYVPGDGSSMTGAGPSRWALSKDAKVSEQTIAVGLQWLLENGWISVVRPGRRGVAPTEYRLHLPSGVNVLPPEELQSQWDGSRHDGTEYDDTKAKRGTAPPDEEVWRREGLPEWA